MDQPTEAPPTFDVLPLSPEVRRAIDELGFVHPTPVQRAVFEPAVRGRDLVVQARTGTGKTAAFGLPIVESLVRRQNAEVQALVLCPTRELAVQVTRDIEALAKHRGVKTAAVYGGAPMPRQVQLIREGAQVLVGTPGRVLDHLRRGTLNAAAIRVLVLDESDEMLSMGFLPQITEILSFLPDTRQTLLFSATLPPDIQRMAETRLRSPEFLTLSGDHIGALEIQHFVYMSFGDKLAELLGIIEIENPESAIVFCNTRDETKRVAGALEQQGFSADWLNADLAQSDREKVMAATRNGSLRFLVATDVAARGIDISHLTHVINFDLPESAEAYLHRTGRTGRAGRMGTAISLIEPSDVGNLYMLRLTYKVRPIEKRLPSSRELKTRAETDVVQGFVDAFTKKPPHAEDLALARRLLSHEQVDAVVAGLLRAHLGERAEEALEAATAARRSKPPPAPPPPREARPERERERERERRPERERERRPERDRERRPERERRPDRDRFERHAGGNDLPKYTAEPMPEPEPVPEGGPDAAAVEEDTNPGFRAPEEAAPVPRTDLAEIYVNVGRRDGADPSHFHALLQARGLGADATDYVRVRHRHSFVGTRKELLERVLSVLNGATIAGKQAMAELARPRE
jgi:ATP-dependent RNA helicase DeaD